MSAVVVDTHMLIWYATKDPRLSAPARAALVNAEQAGAPILTPCRRRVALSGGKANDHGS